MTAVVTVKRAEFLARGDLVKIDGDLVPLIAPARRVLITAGVWQIHVFYAREGADGWTSGYHVYQPGETVEVYGSAT